MISTKTSGPMAPLGSGGVMSSSESPATLGPATGAPLAMGDAGSREETDARRPLARA